MLKNKLSPEETQTRQENLLDLAKSILNGQMQIAPGCLQIQQLLFDLSLDVDKEFIIFTGFNSETDRFPLGQERSLWNQDSLKDKDKELARIEEFYKQQIFLACQAIINKFSSNLKNDSA